MSQKGWRAEVVGGVLEVDGRQECKVERAGANGGCRGLWFNPSATRAPQLVKIYCTNQIRQLKYPVTLTSFGNPCCKRFITRKMFISHCFLTDFPPLSHRILKRHFFETSNMIFIWLELLFPSTSCIWQTRQNHFRSPPPAFVHSASVFSPSLVTAWHLDKCVTVRSVNNGSMMSPYTICRPWTVSLRQTGRKDGTTKCCAVYFWREDKQDSPGSSPKSDKSMGES